VRKAKSEVKASMRADVATATVRAPAAQAARLRLAAADICAAGRIASLTITDADGPIDVVAELAEA
jgi:valyl-tRNA synthetase